MTEGRTGWPPGMLQDDSRELSRWLARRVCGICLCRKAKELVKQ